MCSFPTSEVATVFELCVVKRNVAEIAEKRHKNLTMPDSPNDAFAGHEKPG